MKLQAARYGIGASWLLIASLTGCDDPTESDRPPIAVPGGAYAALEGEPIQFDGSGSSDPKGLPLTFEWDFGNGAVGEGATPTHTYNAAGTYEVALKVTNAKGLSARATTTAVIDPWVADTLARDLFTRTLATGWGNAEIGGEWRLTRSGQDAFSVVDGAGLIAKSDTSMRNAALSGGYGLDVTGLASFSIDRMPDVSSFYTVHVYARRDDAPEKGEGNHHYRFRVRAHSDGAMDLAVDKTVAGVTTFVDDGNPEIETRWEPGAKYWIRWECFGVSPSTTLRIRVWRDGAPEPEAWQLQVTHDEPLLDAPGGTGFRFSGPNTGQTTWPVTFKAYDLFYVKL